MKLWHWILVGGGAFLAYRAMARGSMGSLTGTLTKLNAGNACGEQYMAVQQGAGPVQITVYKFGDMSKILDTLMYDSPKAAEAALVARQAVCG